MVVSYHGQAEEAIFTQDRKLESRLKSQQKRFIGCSLIFCPVGYTDLFYIRWTVSQIHRDHSTLLDSSKCVFD